MDVNSETTKILFLQALNELMLLRLYACYWCLFKFAPVRLISTPISTICQNPHDERFLYISET